MSSVLRVEKVVSALPGILEPDTIYAVRVGAGFDFYMSDTTGAAAHRINQADGSFPVTQALHGFTVGKFVELGDSGWTSTLTKTGRLRGMVSSVLDSSTFSVQRRGIVTGLSGLTPGATLYSSSSGVVGETPSFWGAGAAISATSAEVEPWLPAVGTSVQFWDDDKLA